MNVVVVLPILSGGVLVVVVAVVVGVGDLVMSVAMVLSSFNLTYEQIGTRKASFYRKTGIFEKGVKCVKDPFGGLTMC